MTGDTFSARYLAIVNFSIAEQYGIRSSIVHTGSLKTLEAQVNGSLSQQPPTRKAAFCAYWLSKQRPFKEFNISTAVMCAAEMSNITLNASLIYSFGRAVKNGSSVEELQSILEVNGR